MNENAKNIELLAAGVLQYTLLQVFSLLRGKQGTTE